MQTRRLPSLLSLACMALLVACTSVPDGIQPVSGFQAERYLGR